MGAISYILNAVVFLHTSDVLQNTIYTCSFVVFVSIGLAAYRNLSFVILRRLLTEVNVIMIIVFTVINTIIDSASDRHDYLRHIVMAYIYLIVVFALILVDSIIIKTRAFVLTFGLAFCLLTTFNLIGHTILWDKGVVLFYDFRGEPVYKSSTKRWVFSQLLLFSFKGIKTLLRDKEMAKLLFVTGNIYRDTGEITKKSQDVDNDPKVVSTINPIVLANASNDDIEMIKQPKQSSSQSSNQQNHTTVPNNKKNSIIILGNEETLDNSLKQRVYLSQRIAGIFSFFGFLIYFILKYAIYPSFAQNHPLMIFSLVGMCISGMIVFISIGFMMYKNMSIRIFKLLIVEFNVLIIIASATGNLVMECFKPMIPGLSQITALIFLLCVCGLVLLDTIKFKSKQFVLTYGIFFVLISLSVILQNSFGTHNENIILFHGIGGSTFYKKYIKRTIFIQILSFAFHGLWTILLDKEMELMMFCKAPVYAKTGTTSLRHFSQLED